VVEIPEIPGNQKSLTVIFLLAKNSQKACQIIFFLTHFMKIVKIIEFI